MCNNWKIRYNDFMDKDILDKVRYSTDQLQEIEEGQSKGLEKEIRKGLEGKLEYSQKIWLKDTG
ncbi:hypothetical protein [Agathobacter rectalis]|uniref:hypothetical protein n=1 Tax=Agathobacter rectalis TaxID=39491 RepID=UPI0027D786EA|nr:hypothetical protein [Agathobacter rectalis]